MEFIEYFKEREAALIKAIGEKDWKEQKVYFVDEIENIVSDWMIMNEVQTKQNDTKQN